MLRDTGEYPVRQRRDPQPLDRPHRVLPSLPEGTDPGVQGLNWIARDIEISKNTVLDIRAPTHFVQKCTLRSRRNASCSDEAIEGLSEDAGDPDDCAPGNAKFDEAV